MAGSSRAPLDLYNHPELWRWAGAMEGVPEWVAATETFDERAGRTAWQARGNELFAMLGALLPGLAIALALAIVGSAGSRRDSRSETASDFPRSTRPGSRSA